MASGVSTGLSDINNVKAGALSERTVSKFQEFENGECLISSKYFPVIVKATNGPRYVVGCRRQIDKAKLKSGTRVALDMTTLTIMR